VDDVLSWLAGAKPLGDAGRHAPVVVDDRATGEQIVYAVTQDGLLHAFEADSGTERWAWMPRALLQRLPRLMLDRPGTVRDHGIDGAPVLHRFDVDGNGDIDIAAGEHLWLLFGRGRGGDRYHALDISDADDPRLLWTFAPAAAGTVERWAEPVVTRLEIADSGQSAGHWIVLLAGGESVLRIVDADTGRLLWSAGSETVADLRVPGLDTSLPSAPRALDLDGDGRLDRAYLIDLHGGLWRLDFANGNDAGQLAQARLIARLGEGGQRYYSTPDVSIVRLAGRDHLAIAVASGWYARPLDTTISDRVYLIFDRGTPAATDIITEADLHDASDRLASMPAAARGWFLRLESHGVGEKAVGPAITFNRVLRFQTYQPLPVAIDAPCGPSPAIQRSYALDIRSGLADASAA
jgi:type IV pilus assembly protein PilY1